MGHRTEQRAALQTIKEGTMNNMSDSEALDSFRQTVAGIVRRLMEEQQENNMEKKEKEPNRCPSTD